MSVLDRFRLDGKRLFITGGSRGLGRQMALAIADAGADVVLVGREADTLAATADEIRQFGRKAFPLTGDVGNPDECEAICRRALEEHGPFDILINNVGGRRIKPLLENQTLEEWRQIMDLNLTSTFLCLRHIGGSMVRRGKGGRVINVSSMNGMIVGRNPGGRSYETAKAAVINLTRAAAADWAKSGVTVNAICPGGFMTAPNIRWAKLRPEMVSEFQASLPMGEYGKEEDLGPLAVYLASDASRYMTGASLVIDGGYTIW